MNPPICVAEVLSQGIIPPASSCYLTAGLVGLQVSAIFPIAFLSYSLILCVLNAISGRALPSGLMFMNSTPMTFCFYINYTVAWRGGTIPWVCVLSLEKCLSNLSFCFCSEGYEGIVGIPAQILGWTSICIMSLGRGDMLIYIVKYCYQQQLTWALDVFTWIH